jgi:pilus assembly protein CpaE
MYPLKAILIGCELLPEVRRELGNLSIPVEGEYIDVGTCLAKVLSNPSDRRLFVVHPASQTEISQVERLNESVVGQPILALVDPTQDQSMMLRAMRAGAAQVVRLPLQLDDLRAATHRIAVQFGHSSFKSQLIVVIGAGEGCGCTTVALNLASELGRLHNAPCILSEGAVSFGRLANYLGIEPKLTTYDLLSEPDRLDIERVRQALFKVEDNLLVLAGSYKAITPFTLTAEAALGLVEYAKQLSDLIVVDSRYQFEDVDFDFVSRARHIVVLAKPTIPSLHSSKLLLDLLARRECIGQQYIVINQFVRGDSEFSKRALEAALDVTTLFTVASDPPAVRAAENAGETLRKAAPHSRALADITALARNLLALPAEERPDRGGFLKSLSRMAHSLSDSLSLK